jgi:hypothetical protein
LNNTLNLPDHTGNAFEWLYALEWYFCDSAFVKIKHGQRDEFTINTTGKTQRDSMPIPVMIAKVKMMQEHSHVITLRGKSDKLYMVALTCAYINNNQNVILISNKIRKS